MRGLTFVGILSLVITIAYADTKLCKYETDEAFILGGAPAALGEFPWMALLGYLDASDKCISFKCGGSIINERFILTAWHCLSHDLKIVRLGEWKISTDPDSDGNIKAPKVIDINIASQIKHPEFGYYKSDIALLKLEKDVTIGTKYVDKIILPTLNQPLPPLLTRLTVAGWGGTENDWKSDVLLKVVVPLKSNDDCARTTGTVLTEKQMCAGGEEGKDSCLRDSGSPLMNKNNANEWYQEGIVSYGYGCGLNGTPAVYTRVAAFIDWIEDNSKVNEAIANCSCST